MNIDDIKKHFRVDRFSSVPVYRQIEDCLRALIAKAPAGAEIPSERLLASTLKVNRLTIRKAVGPLIKEGVLKRGGGVTITAEGSADSAPHPFLMDSENIRPHATLKLAVYENMRHHVLFWEDIARAFQNLNPGVRVSVEYVPPQVDSENKYTEYLRCSRPDIFQLNYNMVRYFEAAEMLRELPSQVKTLFGGGTHRMDPMKDIRSGKMLSDNIVPFALTSFAVVWNNDLAEKAGVADIPSPLPAAALTESMFQAGGKLAAPALVFGNVWNYIAALGLPGSPEEITEEFFLRRFEPLKAAGRNMFILRQESPNQMRDIFISGSMLFFAGILNFILRDSPLWRFSHSAAPLIPEENTFLSCGVECLAAHPRTECPDLCGEFALFMLSKTAQDMVADKHKSLPVSKESDKSVESVLPSLNMRKMSDGLIFHKAQALLPEKLYEFIIYDMHDILQDIVSSDISPQKAAARALDRYMRKISRKADLTPF